MMLEPRSFPRADVELSLQIRVDGHPLPGRTLNLSECGALVRVAAPLEKDERVTLALSLGSGVVVAIAASVVRSTKEEGGPGYAVALAFEDVDEGTATAIRAIVERNNPMAWSASAGCLPREIAVKLVPAIRRLARGLVRRLPPQVSVDDLVGAGFVALVELYANHPGASAAELERIAIPRVRWAMLEELRNSDPLSRRMRQRTRRIATATTALEHELGRAPSSKEVASKVNLSVEACAAALQLARNGEALRVDALDDFELPDACSAGPEERADHGQTMSRVRTAVDALPPRLKHILELYYGEELTLRQIGNVLGVTEARISQLLSDAVKKLRISCSSDVPALSMRTRGQHKSSVRRPTGTTAHLTA